LIVCAVTGGRAGVVEKLDALVKGYQPDYGFHGVDAPDSTLAPVLATDSPPRPATTATPPKSIH